MSSAADTTANSSTIPKGRTKAYTAYKQMKLKYNAKELAPTPYTQYQAQNLVCGIYASFKRMETLRQLEVNFLQRSLKWSYFEMIWFETERDWLVHMKERERLTLELLKLEDRMLFTRERHQQPASNSTSSESKLKRGVPGFINGQKACAIADTGAGNNIISESLARQMNLTIEPSTTTFRIGNRERVKSVGTVSLDWSFSDEKSKFLPIICHVLPRCIYDLILGRAFLDTTKTLTKFKHRLQQCISYAGKFFCFGFAGNDGQRLRGLLAKDMEVLALVDSGAERNIMGRDFALAQGFHIDSSPDSCGYLEFADCSIQATVGQVRTSWTFENGDTVPVTFEVLENCIVDVVLGEEITYQHDILEAHSSSLIYLSASDEYPELAPFDYWQKWPVLKKLKQNPASTPALGSSHCSRVAEERARREKWNCDHDFGRNTNAQEREAEACRRREFDLQNHHVPRIPGLTASQLIRNRTGQPVSDSENSAPTTISVVR